MQCTEERRQPTKLRLSVAYYRAYVYKAALLARSLEVLEAKVQSSQIRASFGFASTLVLLLPFLFVSVGRVGGSSSSSARSSHCCPFNFSLSYCDVYVRTSFGPSLLLCL